MSMISQLIEIGVSFWYVVNESILDVFYATNVLTVSATVQIAAGVLNILLCALVFTRWHYTNSIPIYATIAFSGACNLVALSLGAIFLTTVNDEKIRNAMKVSLSYYYGRPDSGTITQAWDSIQPHLHCCAIDQTDSFSFWKSSLWYRMQVLYPMQLVPQSCCIGNDRITAETLTNCTRPNELKYLKWPQSGFIYEQGCLAPLLSHSTKVSALLCLSTVTGLAANILVAVSITTERSAQYGQPLESLNDPL